MQLHQLKPIHKNKKKRRIGRGGKRGTTSGRGTKGQKSRTGANIRPAIYDFIKKIPKLRGYKFRGIKEKSQIINLKDLKDYFKDGDKITPKILIEKKLVKQIGKKIPNVKILGDGEIDIKLTIENCLVSKSAKEKIEKIGGKIYEKNK